MRYSNLHNHTNFSDGKHTVEENILSAIEKNMLSLGFSDHSFTACDPSYCMHEHQYPEYFQTIDAMRRKYADQIPVYTGMELDVFSEIEREKFDYIIASAHYIEKNGVYYPIDHTPQQQIQCMEEGFGGDIFKMAEHYFQMLAEHVHRVKPTFVGHYDVITKFSLMPEDSEKYRDMAKEYLREILKDCSYLEMNTGAISRGWRKTPYPNGYLLQTMLENDGQLLLGSDSHNKDNLTFFFDEAVQIMKNAGFTEVAVFNGKTFDMVGI